MGGDFFPIFHVLDTYKGMNEWGSVWGLGFRGYKGGAVEDTVAVVKSGCDECVYECFGSWECQRGSDAGNVFEVEKSSFSDLIYVGEK